MNKHHLDLLKKRIDPGSFYLFTRWLSEIETIKTSRKDFLRKMNDLNEIYERCYGFILGIKASGIIGEETKNEIVSQLIELSTMY